MAAAAVALVVPPAVDIFDRFSTGGSERLLKALVRAGLDPDALRPAAALCIALDRTPDTPTGITLSRGAGLAPRVRAQ